MSESKLVTFELYGASITFNHKAKKGEHFFTMPNGHGFYPNDKEFTSVWGRPFKANCKEVAEYYVSTSEGRTKTLKTYANLNKVK